MDKAPSVLLVAPPWRIPNLSSLALGTLTPILRGAGIACDELHGSVLFPQVANPFHILETYARYLFVPTLTGCDIEPLLDLIIDDLVHEASMNEIIPADRRTMLLRVGLEEESLKAAFRHDIKAAETCLARTLERALAKPYDIIAFSLTFDDQVPAALALTRQVKAVRPEVRIAFGGAACLEEQADGLAASFREVDAVCHTEGESVVVPLMRALVGDGDLAEVPGVAWRRPDGTIQHNPSPPLLRDLDSLPVPDYRGFLEQYQATPRASELGPRLMFETSRGCWWGQKSLCSFCGLNAEGLSFRSKTPERAFDEITHLWRDHPQAIHLQAADNIVEMKYLTTLFPRLAATPPDPARPLKMFYEVKTNMKAEQVAVMAAAGVDRVQPGIESFSDGVLEHMRKGCTALGQIQFLKWCYESGIEPMYNIILRNPGDRADWYRDMAGLLPAIAHLPAPNGIVTMHLERFSPYHSDPAAFGITGIRPRPYYKLLYPWDGVDHDRLAYQFDFEHPSHRDGALAAAWRECAEFMTRWRSEWKADRLVFVDEGGRLGIMDRRHADSELTVLAGARAELFVYLDSYRTREQIATAFPHLDAALLDALLLEWVQRRFAVNVGDRYLVVVPRQGPRRTEPRSVKRSTRSLPQLSAQMM